MVQLLQTSMQFTHQDGPNNSTQTGVKFNPRFPTNVGGFSPTHFEKHARPNGFIFTTFRAENKEDLSCHLAYVIGAP